ncbi:hypothetical protein ABH905_001393 [Pseudomonas frederiksbergensis]|uniref:DUF6124 family protein n=1 Tax=Pseudomonas frederiksbergensis TaxID=104087 RepID=UPI003D1F0AD7
MHTNAQLPPLRSAKRNGVSLLIPGSYIYDQADTEALLANASEDLKSISAIAANLADDVDGARRSLALALSRLADGVRLLVERALDHIDSPNPAEHRAKT